MTARFTRAIKPLTQALAVAGKDHETLTCFYLVKTAERLQANPGADWEAFEAANPDLFAPAADAATATTGKRCLNRRQRGAAGCCRT